VHAREIIPAMQLSAATVDTLRDFEVLIESRYGVQRCGKSLAAKAVAGEWGRPLLRLDSGRLYEVCFHDLPAHADRGTIVAIHLRKRHRDLAAFDPPLRHWAQGRGVMAG
jgi:D-serine deaminase-like pyridoxal phosphate-dependent protein